jgi:hypothetical protein
MLKEILGWNKAPLSCFVKMLLTLFAVRTMNLRELATICFSSLYFSIKYNFL